MLNFIDENQNLFKKKIAQINEGTILHALAYGGENLKHLNFIPLKNSIRSADNSSTKLPVTDLNEAPLWGADSNIRWYKFIGFEIEFNTIINNTLEFFKKHPEYINKIDKTYFFIEDKGGNTPLDISILNYNNDFTPFLIQNAHGVGEIE